MRPELLVHLVFHPRSERGRRLATEVHRALNDDPVVPGLRIPTSFCPTVGGAPPDSLDLAQAERNFVVALADTKMNLDVDWCTFVGDLGDRPADGDDRFVPVQLDSEAWPLDRRLDGTNFVRAFDAAESDVVDLVVRRLVVELCRFLAGRDVGTDGRAAAPTTVFLSHTKLDVESEPRVVEQLVELLRSDQPIDAWVDSGDIGAGSRFADDIAAGVRGASMLCVLTDNYASREWCRREVLEAKRAQRPIVVVDALTSREVRSFPYLGNLPVVRWTGDGQVAIDLLLKETLRELHTRATLERVRRANDHILTRAPELLTVAQAPADSTILYPDPPLGLEELGMLDTIGRTVVTPLGRIAQDRGLDGMKIALSTSASSDIERVGFDPVHLASTLLELSRHLLIRGATLVYGGHMGDAGYTHLLLELVRTHNELSADSVQPLRNYIGWPLPFDEKHVSTHKWEAQLIRVDRPPDITEDLDPALIAEPDEVLPYADKPEFRYAWARGMTAMRAQQVDEVDARIVVGGKTGLTVDAAAEGGVRPEWYSGRVPGVLEEVVLSVQAGQPVFLVGAFGGVASLVMDVIDGVDRPEMTWDFQRDCPHSQRLRELYAERDDEWIDYPEMIELLRGCGLAGLSTLDADRHRELYSARNLEGILPPLLEGLGALR